MMFSHEHQLPSSLSDMACVFQQVIATSNYLAKASRTHTATLNKLQITLGLNIAGNIWDNVSTKLNKISNMSDIFRHYNAKMLRIIALNRLYWYFKIMSQMTM